MAVTAQQSRPLLPQGVGRFTPAWRLFFLAMFLIAGFGLFAYWRETSQGMVVTGISNKKFPDGNCHLKGFNG